MSDDTPNTPIRHPVRTAILLLVIVVAVCAALLEFGSGYILNRTAPAPIKAHDLSQLDATFVTDPVMLWRLEPNLDNYHVVGRCWDRDVDFTMSTNALGLRDDPIPETKTRTRILALGDSITFGLGVNNGQDWPAQLEQLLNAKAGKDKYEVINGGVPGYSAFQGLRFLDKRGFDLDPDLVIACFGQNDFDTWNNTTDIENAAALAEEARLREESPSDFLLLAQLAMKGARHAMESGEGEKKPRLTPEEFRDTLLQFARACEEHTVPLLLLRWPQEWQVLENKSEPIHYEPILLDTAKETGVPVVDLFPAFRAAKEPLYADPVHANATGCHVTAEALVAPVLKALEVGE